MPSPDGGSDSGIVTKSASGSVDETVAALTSLVESKGMTLFAIIDHSGQARRHGLELRDTKVVIFGSPTGGTPVMDAVPLTALDLPLKILVWDDGGQTRISYTDPGYLAARHHLPEELAARPTGINGITDGLAS